MASVKFSDAVRPFSGEGDVLAWIQKVELVAKLTSVSDVASFLPLYLEEGALSVYLEMPDKDKSDIGKIKARLLKAFSVSAFEAFNRLKQYRWTGEPVEVFATELRKLGRECGFKDEGLEHVVRLALVSGFPEHISKDLQQMTGIENKQVSCILDKARVLTSGAGGSGNGLAASVGTVSPTGQKLQEQGCFECGGSHMKRDCPVFKERMRKTVCFRCKQTGHMAYDCDVDLASLGRGRGDRRRNWNRKGEEKRHESNNGSKACAGRAVGGQKSEVPIIEVRLKGNSRRALVDTGCATSLLRKGMVPDSECEGTSAMVAFDGRTVLGKGKAKVDIEVGDEIVGATVNIVDELVGNIDMVLGMDVIQKLGGVSVRGDTVHFGSLVCAVVPESMCRRIEDPDFEAWFDGRRWTARYKMKAKRDPRLTNKVPFYDKNQGEETREAFKSEVRKWIEEGILVPWEGEVGGIIPLMAIEQETKNKVRPVMDFRELNQFVECHTGGEVLDVCSDRLREWRRVEGQTQVVDLKAAYLQIRVVPDLWKYQVVEFEGRRYALTRLGFGLCSAPRIMSKILKTVLSRDDEVRRGTSSYIDDIMVDTSVVAAQDVVSHLQSWGLEGKEPTQLEGSSVLGLKLHRAGDKLAFTRGNDIPSIEEVSGKKVTRRELFSMCGKLVGHYPVAGWLRVACGFLKRTAEGSRWEDDIGEKAHGMLEDMLRRVGKEDPVFGSWEVEKTKRGTVWCDASDLATGVIVEVEGCVVEDAAWLRKKDDVMHINVAELDAALKGINLAIHWGLTEIMLMTDSATVRGWIDATLGETKKVGTKGAAELLVKRRLCVLKELVSEFNLCVKTVCVASGSNKADSLTRVKSSWLQCVKKEADDTDIVAAGLEEVRKHHEQHHFGVERSWYLMKEMEPGVTKEEVKKVVRECERCQSIDPASSVHEPGELGVDTVWTRLSLDVTHYKASPYLTIVDCGPGRLAIWKLLKEETASAICRELEELFWERGPVEEVLMDNAAAFRSAGVSKLLEKWGVRKRFRAAHRASGNGIVERNHRTVKAVAERGRIDPREAVYWYNISPKDRQKTETVPHLSVFTYHPRQLGKEEVEMHEPVESPYSVGQEVWVKPPIGRCTTQWGRGTVTGVNSKNNLEIDGMPRHVLDVRGVTIPTRAGVLGTPEQQTEGLEENTQQARRYPLRERRAPAWTEDYELV